MSQDILNSQIRTNAIITTTNGPVYGAQPKILIYDKSFVLNGNSGNASTNGQRKNALDSFVTQSNNFPNDTLLYIHGIPTTSTEADLAPTSAGQWSTMFGGDVIINGTLFVNKLRNEEDGSLINFSSISYSAPADNHGGGDNDISSIWNDGAPISAGEADGDLALKILENAANITTNISNIGNKVSQTDFNALSNTVSSNLQSIGTISTDISELTISTGLTDQTYTAHGSSNYLKASDFLAYDDNTGLSESLHHADKLLDLKIRENEIEIAVNSNKVGITQEQTDAIIANTLKIGITQSQADAIVANTAKVVITAEQGAAIVANTGKIGITAEQAQAIVDNSTKTGITVEQAQAIVDNSTKTGITAEQAAAIATNTGKTGITPEQVQAIVDNSAKTGITVEQAAAIVTNSAKVGITQSQADDIASFLPDVSNIFGLINLHEKEIGLNTNGVLQPYDSTNFITNAYTDAENNQINQDTLKKAIEALDTQVKVNKDEISDNLDLISDLEGSVASTRQGAGLNLQTGAYTKPNNTNYLNDAESLRDADFALDSRIRINEVAITSLGDLPGTVLELSKLKASVGTDANGDLVAFAQTTYLDGIEVVKTALTTLDTAIASKVSNVFDLTGIDPDNNTKQDGRILQYVAEDAADPENVIAEHFKYVDASTGPQGEAATITVGTVTTGDAGTDATISNSGTANAAVFDFTIPKGAAGEDGVDGEDGAAGEAATIAIGTVTTGAAGTDVTVTNSGSANAAVFDFTIPKGSDGAVGEAATISVGTVTTGADGSDALVTNSGNANVAVFDFTIPKGADGSDGSDGSDGTDGVDGAAATITVGTVTTGDAGTNVTITNTGNANAAVFDFTIPKGAAGSDGEAGAAGSDGTDGADGAAATIVVGTVTTGDAGTNVIVSNSGNANAAVFDFTIPKGADGADGVDGEDGTDGTDGTDAPTITNVSISGTTVTTTLSAGAPLSGTYSSSIGDLTDVDISSVAPTNNQVLKWDNSTSKFKPADDVNGGGGSGVDLSVTDNSTSVSGTATLDVQQLATVEDSGGNEATLVGIIGSAEDDDYSDGLFSSFTSTTRIGHAIDKFNEVLKALAPSPAPDLSQFDVNTSSSSLSNILLSFGETNDQSLASPSYHTVLNTAGFTDLSDKIDVNESFPVTSENNNYRRGVYTGTTTLEGDLNENVSQDAYTNGIVNYLANSFGEGNLGTLQLWLNGSNIHTIDLTTFGSGNDLNANGSGFINVTDATDGKFSSDTAFSNFKHRQGQWRVHHSDQRNGWNHIQVKHVIGANEKVTGYAEWVNDNNSDEIAITNKSLTLNKIGSKHISGIEYNTSVTATYSAEIDNFYKYIYKSGNITFDESPASLASFDDFSIPSIDTAGGEDHTKQINLTKTTTLLLDNNRILNGTLQTGFNLSHPVKTDITSASTNQTINSILVDNQTATSTNLLSNFDDEDHRLIDTTSYFMSGVEDNTYQWDSTESLAGSDDGHKYGLMVYNSRLYTPKSSDLPNNGDFTNINSNPNYSVIGNDNRVWIRKFKNTTGNPINALLFNINKDNSNVEDTSSLNASQINIQFKIPSKSGPPLNPQTNWLSVASDFDLAGYLNETLTTCGDSTYNGNINGNTITNKIAVFKEEVANNDYVLVKITASHDWIGYVDSFSVSFDNVIGNTSSSPEVTHIDFEQSGVACKLSFGTSNTIADFTNYTSDVNSNFHTSSDAGDGAGLFNNNQTFTGHINNLTASDGNNYLQYAFGGDEANTGTLKLHVNGNDIHTIELSSTPYLSGSQVNGNGSGFTNLTAPVPARDTNNRPDYSKIFRTSKFVIDTDDQRLGYNFAKVIHVKASGDEESNTITWINDNNTDAPDFTNDGAITYSIDNSSITSTEKNFLSGIEYYKKVTNIPYEIQVRNLYKNIYSESSMGVRVLDAVGGKLNVKTLNQSGVNGNLSNDNHSAAGDTSQIARPLTGINLGNATGAQNEILKINSILSANYIKSIPDINSGTPYSGMNDITVDVAVIHPLTAPLGKTTSGASEQATSDKLLQYEVSSTTQSVVVEDFTNETKRIPTGAYSAQADASGASWDSTSHLTDGLMVYDENLVYPKVDFRDSTDSGSIIAPSGNPNYSSQTGAKTFYRIFQNNTNSSQQQFTLQLQGDETVISESLSATDIKISVKIPNTAENQTTGFLNIAKDFETDQYSDGDGALSGSLSSAISSGNTVTNTVTFGVKYLKANEYFVMKIEADNNWTGYLSNIEIVWS